MDFLWDSITEWLKEMLVSGIVSNLSGMFDHVNQKVGEISAQVGTTPQAWNSGVFNMVHSLSETVIIPIAGMVLAFVMTLELIQLIIDKNNLNDVDTWMFFKWVFKTACAILIVTNTWNIVMGVFDVAQSVVSNAAGVVIRDASIDISSVVSDMETRLMAMDLGPLFGLWFQSLFVGITMWALTICIFIIVYGRMVEIYLVTSVAPLPMATMLNREWGQMGQNYLRSLFALGFQAFLIPHYRMRGHLRRPGAEHRRGQRHQRGDLDLHGVHRPFVLHPVQDRQPRKKRVQRPLNQKEVQPYGLCQRPERFEPRQEQGHVQPDRPAACLLRLRCAYRRPTVLPAQRLYRHQRGDPAHGAGDAAFLHAGDVRKERPAFGEGSEKLHSGAVCPAQAAALPDRQLLCRLRAAVSFGQGGKTHCLQPQDPKES